MIQARKSGVLQQIVLVLMALIGIGCAPMKPQVTGQQIPLGFDNLQPLGLVILPNKQVGVTVEISDAVWDNPKSPEPVRILNLDDGQMIEIAIVPWRECGGRWFIGVLEGLPNGKLLVGAQCRAVGSLDDYLLLYDVATKQTTDFFPFSIPGAALISLNPAMDRAIVDFGTLYSGVFWVDANGIEPIQAKISSNGQTISLAQGYLESKGIYAHSTGNVKDPAWSPNGSTVALFASFDSIGKSGFDRVTGEWVLALLDTQTLSTTIIADGIYSPHLMIWTADSRRLIYSAKGSHGIRGLWQISLDDHVVRLLVEGEFTSFIMGPTGQDIYAIRCKQLGTVCDEREVWRYELPEKNK